MGLLGSFLFRRGWEGAGSRGWEDGAINRIGESSNSGGRVLRAEVVFRETSDPTEEGFFEGGWLRCRHYRFMDFGGSGFVNESVVVVRHVFFYLACGALPDFVVCSNAVFLQFRAGALDVGECFFRGSTA